MTPTVEQSDLRERVAKAMVEHDFGDLGAHLDKWMARDDFATNYRNLAHAALEAAQVDAMRSRIERLEEALRKCSKIVERNLYHQHEKIEDVPKIARAVLGDDG